MRQPGGTRRKGRLRVETKPLEATDEQLKFLDALRESGATNMFGAGPYLVEAFDVTRAESRKILAHWMRTFAERHPERAR